MRLRTLLRNRIHAVLADHGHSRPGGCWSGPGRAWLAALEVPAASREVIEDGLALIDALQEPIDRPGEEIRQHARCDPRVKVLTQLPGVGPFTALVILAGPATSAGSPPRARVILRRAPVTAADAHAGADRAAHQQPSRCLRSSDGSSSLPIRALQRRGTHRVFSHTAVLVVGVLVAAVLGVRLGMDCSQQAERSVPGAAQTSP